MVRLKNGATYNQEAFKAWEDERHQAIVTRAIRNKAKRERTRKFVLRNKPKVEPVTYLLDKK